MKKSDAHNHDNSLRMSMMIKITSNIVSRSDKFSRDDIVSNFLSACRDPADVILALDVTGSPDDVTTMTTFTRQLLQALDMDAAYRRLGMIHYGSTAHVVGSLSATPDIGYLLSSVDDVTAGDSSAGSRVDLAMTLMMEDMLGGSSHGRRNVIVFLTAGSESVDKNRTYQLARQVSLTVVVVSGVAEVGGGGRVVLVLVVFECFVWSFLHISQHMTI